MTLQKVYQEDVCAYVVFDARQNRAEIKSFRMAGMKPLYSKEIPVDTPAEAAEFVALVATLKFCKENDLQGKVYSRCAVAVAGVLKSRNDTGYIDRTFKTDEFPLVASAKAWLIANQPRNLSEIWDDKSSGDMLAYIDWS